MPEESEKKIEKPANSEQDDEVTIDPNWMDKLARGGKVDSSGEAADDE